MKDSYQIFLNKFLNKEDLIKFGLEETIYIDYNTAEEKWIDLKNRIKNNKIVFIRGYGRNSSNSEFVLEFYKRVFENNKIQIDKTNNAAPSRLLNECTPFRKSIKKDSNSLIKIQNYQISHVFGKAKNPFLFTAAWNIVYIPKLLDPLTGHESKGELTNEFKAKFQRKTYSKFKDLIIDYNSLIKKYNIKEELNQYIITLQKKSQKLNLEKFKNDILLEFENIMP